MSRRLRILTWHEHGNYLYYLTQVPHDFFLLTDPQGRAGRVGRVGALPWGHNVHEVRVDQLAALELDLVIYQSRLAWEVDRTVLLTEAQRAAPAVYIEHDPPQAHPTDTCHWVRDGRTLLVHVTHYNALMWDNGAQPTRVIEHGVKLLHPAQAHYTLPRGVAVINNLDLRGRRLGFDVFVEASRHVPIDLTGMGAQRLGAGREVANPELPQHLAQYRFLFNPMRYTSLGLALIEAMMVGLPIVGLPTTELTTVIRNGENGVLDTRMNVLTEAMHWLIDTPEEARRMGANARRTAVERFGIERFVADWTTALEAHVAQVAVV